VIEEYGIIDAFYHKVYPIVVRSAATMTKQLEQSISYLEQQSKYTTIKRKTERQLSKKRQQLHLACVIKYYSRDVVIFPSINAVLYH